MLRFIDRKHEAQDDVGGEDKQEKILFTEEQQKHLDTLIAQQYAKINAKAEKKIQEIKEAEKLKSLSAEERAQAELEIANQKLKEYERKELSTQYKLELTSKGLPKEFAEYVNVADAEQAKKSIDFLSGYTEKIIKEKDAKIKELEEELKNIKLRGPIPKNLTNAPTGEKQAITKII